MKLEITYQLDDESWTDEEYHNQPEKTIEISESELIKILTYGYFPNQVDLNPTESIEIISVKEINI